MGEDPWVDRGIFPPTFLSKGDAVCFDLTHFFGVDIFCRGGATVLKKN